MFLVGKQCMWTCRQFLTGRRILCGRCCCPGVEIVRQASSPSEHGERMRKPRKVSKQGRTLKDILGPRVPRNSLPLIAEMNSPEYVSSKNNLTADIDSKLKELDEMLNLLQMNDSDKEGLFSHAEKSIEDNLAIIREELGDEYDFVTERMKKYGDMREKRRKLREELKTSPTQINYGSPDPNEPISDVPCQGCGAYLHCQDSGIQGYIPSEKYLVLEKTELEKTLCQRCHLLKFHNVALNIRMDPKEFQRIIQEIRPKKALVIVIVDLADMPNSIVDNLLDMIGQTQHSICLVGNKVDLLPRDGLRFLERVKECLKRSCAERGIGGPSIKHVCLVSAKTGYGIEELVTKLFNQWDRKGDVYMIGSTNVGKSSLFNALLSSDYCKSRARELFSRATTSVWPGTTLGLLKFPIERPRDRDKFLRTRRLIDQRREEAMNKELAEKDRIANKIPLEYHKSLIGHIGTTRDYFPGVKPQAVWDTGLHPNLVSFKVNTEGELETSELDQTELHRQAFAKQTEALYEDSKWCYDTPGVINPSQIINYLTQRELSNLILKKSLLIPRTYVLHPGMTMYVGGLGRLDYVQGDSFVYLTVHSSLPVFVVSLDKAGDFYEENVDQGLFKVPLKRSKTLPPLTGESYTITGINLKESAADVVLSSAGWVSVSPAKDHVSTLQCSTPGAKGLCLRQPSLLPLAVNQRGKRVKGLPMYLVRK